MDRIRQDVPSAAHFFAIPGAFDEMKASKGRVWEHKMAGKSHSMEQDRSWLRA